MIIKRTPTVNLLAQAMRFFFIKGFKNQIIKGEIKSKYFPQFIVSPILLILADL